MVVEEERDEVVPNVPTTLKDELKLTGGVLYRKEEDPFGEIRNFIYNVDNNNASCMLTHRQSRCVDIFMP